MHRDPWALRGRPAAAGTYQVTITISGLDGGVARVRFLITVKRAAVILDQVPVVDED